MIIRSLTLRNFMCYYGDKTFDFSPGLNIILGHNGDGKSTIFRAFNWIFDSHSDLKGSDIFSKKRYSEIIDGESFDVSVTCIVEQGDFEYSISKILNVSKFAGSENISNLKEEIFKKRISTGEKSIERRSVSDLIVGVFPEAFRNFSMFESETDALKIVEGEQLANLVKSFSNAKYYDSLDEVIESFAEKADRQFRRESNSDRSLREAIDKIDSEIAEIKGRISNIDSRIEEDERGREFLSGKISEIISNLSISDEFKKLEDEGEKLQLIVERAKNEIKSRINFTDRIFDDFYILKGFSQILDSYSVKIDELRRLRNKIDNDERISQAEKKLELATGGVPLPPGTPSIEILKEILDDDICKICNTTLSEKAREYINRSISIFEESRKNTPKFAYKPVFRNTYLEEFHLIGRSIGNDPDKFSKDRIDEEISFGLERIKECNRVIAENNLKLEQLNSSKTDLIGRVQNLKPDELLDVRKNHEKYTADIEKLVHQLGENRVRRDMLNRQLSDLEISRNKTLGQFKESDFKQATVDFLKSLSKVAKKVKDDEYTKFLNVLSQRATAYLKEINIDEITGKIELYKKNNKEVSYRSLNEDNSIRSVLEDSGALQISKPLSILFAISDIASETMSNETYPMIFDAPTGRFSPDREAEFFKVLKRTEKQRIVVTLRFLESDSSNGPFVNKAQFQNIEKDKAFFIKRVRPYDKDKPETIDTIIDVIV